MVIKKICSSIAEPVSSPIDGVVAAAGGGGGSTQYARPDSDLSFPHRYVQFGTRYGWWAKTPTDDLYEQVDEAVADDSDYFYFRSDGGDNDIQWYKSTLSDIDEPSDLSSVSIRVRIKNNVRCYVYLYDGSTRVFNGYIEDDNSSITDVDLTLSSTEAGNITDWSDLRLWFGCWDETWFETCYIYQAYLEAGAA